MRSLAIFGSLLLLASSLLVNGCKPKYQKRDIPVSSPVPDQESIFKSNQSLIRKNVGLIREKAAIKGWNLTETGTGVFFQIFRKPKKIIAKKIEPGDWVSLTYKLSLLDGTECYSSKNQGLKQFFVEKSEAEPGLHEAVQFLHPNDSAMIIIPPHRAFGLVGDGNRIPPLAVLIYQIRVDSVVRQGSH